MSALGFADGGYFPTSWGWAGLGLSWAAVVAGLLVGDRRVSRNVLLLLGLLALLAVWIAASLAWTRSASLTVPELQRMLVYLAGVGAAVLLVRDRTWRALLHGVLAGSSIVVLWGLVDYLATREEPPAAFEFSLLHEPMGYANAMAVTAVIAIVLALALVVDSRSSAARIGAGVLLVPLAPALALTGSRAAWGALLVGLAVAIGLSRSRLHDVATILTVAIAPAIAVAVIAFTNPTDVETVGARADRLGERLIVALGLLTLAAFGPAFLVARSRWAKGLSGRLRWLRLGVPAVLVVGAVVTVLVVESPGFVGDRPTYWKVAVHELGEHPVLGTGAGTYAQVWLERRPNETSVRDAHSNVVETLSELGVVGLVLVVALLAAPLLWGVRARSRPLVPFAAGAFAAYATHAAVDWDWEMPAVTLAGLFCAVSLAVAAGAPDSSVLVSRGWRGAAVALGVVAAALAFVGLIGARSLTDAVHALAGGDAVGVEQAAKRAERLQPWSVEPLLVRGQAALARGDRQAARELFTRAVERDPNDYRTWLALAAVSNPDKAQQFVLRARELNPRAVRSEAED